MPLSETVAESEHDMVRLLAEQNEILMGLLLMIIEKQYRPEKESALDDFQMEFNLTHLADLRERFVPCLSGKQVRDGRMESTCLGNGSSNSRQMSKVQTLPRGLFGAYLSPHSRRDRFLSALGRNRVDANKSKRNSGR